MDATHSAFADRQEWRRMRSLSLKQRGYSQRVIAEALGVSTAVVSQWFVVSEEGRPEALRSYPAPGRVCRLTAQLKCLIPDFLWYGAEAYGFCGQVWTCARIASVIETEFGIAYHKNHVGWHLKELQ